MPTPEQIDALTKLGVAGLALFFVCLFVFGIITTVKAKNEWRDHALALDDRLDRLTAAVETSLNIRVPPKP